MKISAHADPKELLGTMDDGDIIVIIFGELMKTFTACTCGPGAIQTGNVWIRKLDGRQLINHWASGDFPS